MPPYPPHIQPIIDRAKLEAHASGRRYFGSEHLLLAVVNLANGEIAELMRRLKLDEATIRHHMPAVDKSYGPPITAAQMPPTEGIDRALEYARQEVGGFPISLFLGLARENQVSSLVLQKCCVGHERMRVEYSRMVHRKQLEAEVEKLRDTGAPVVPFLQSAAADATNVERQWEAVQMLAELREKQPTLRATVLHAFATGHLADLHDAGPSAFPEIIALLPDPLAFQTLGNLRDPRAIPLLLEHLDKHFDAASSAIATVMPDSAFRPRLDRGRSPFVTARELCQRLITPDEKDMRPNYVDVSSEVERESHWIQDGFREEVVKDHSHLRQSAREELLRRTQRMLDATLAACCRSCGCIHRLATQHAGKRGKCPTCGSALVVPATSQK